MSVPEGPEREQSVTETATATAPGDHAGSWTPRSGDPSAAGYGEFERGSSIDRYVVLDRLGAGGMGVVYAAYDPELDRRVALKLLLPGRGDGEAGSRAATRLLREAQAMARLSHPNVVAVHDVGTFEDHIFVAMEFVEGPTLREWMRGEPPLARILEVFGQAGQGLAAAHAGGLIHRDFKPANVLVGNDGRVRVLDFGLARAIEEETGDEPDEEPEPPEPETLPSGSGGLSTPLTRTGAVMGTPAYMAPEQHLAAQVDARCDQFSFCVALWEAVFGERPFHGATRVALMQAVLAGEIATPVHERRVPGSLTKALRQGMSVEPKRRHANMDELLAAIAPPEKRGSRAWWGVGLAGLTVAAVGGYALAPAGAVGEPEDVCGAVSDQLDGVWDAETRERVETAFGAVDLPFSRSSFDRVAEGMDRYAEQWIAARLDTCEDSRVRQEQSDLLHDLRVHCLEERRAEFEALAQALGEVDAAGVQRAVSWVDRLSPLDRCSDTQALTTRPAPPEDPVLREQVHEQRELLARAKTLRTAASTEDAYAIAVPAVDSARELGYRPLTAEALWLLGYLQDRKGNTDQALETMQEAVFAAEASGHDEQAVRAASMMIYMLGYQKHEHEQAALYVKLGQAAWERGGKPPRVGSTLMADIGSLDLAQGKYDEARAWYERASQLRIEVFGPDDPAVASDLNTLGAIADYQGKRDEAIELYQRALRIDTAHFGADHPQTAANYYNMSILFYHQQQYAKAREHSERAMKLWEPVLGPDHPNIGLALNNLGLISTAERDFDGAIATYERQLGIAEKTEGKKSRGYAMALGNMAEAYSAKGDHARAIELFEESLEIRSEVLGTDHPSNAITLFGLAQTHLSAGSPKVALEHFERALAIDEKALGAEHPDLGYPLTGVGRALHALGRSRAALPHLERALALREKEDGPDTLAHTRFSLAEVLWELGQDRARALTLAEQARAHYATVSDRKGDELEEVQQWLTRASG